MSHRVGALPSSVLGWRLARIRALVRRRRLDADLADRADPWRSGELVVRASQLGSLAERRKVAAGLISLVELAAYQRRGSPSVTLRHQLVLEQRESLLALAERLARFEPVDVAVVAQLELLLTDPASPVYAGGGDPYRLAEVTERCLGAVAG